MVIRTLLLAALLITQQRAALAQDRPLLEPFRIGYPADEPIAERMQAAGALDQALRRKGFTATWLSFDSGLAAVRALHDEEVDLALNASLADVVAAKRENLKMVFVAELRSIAPSCCDLEQLFADQIFKRYTLSSEYFADRREDVLLIVHQEMIRALQRGDNQLANESENHGPVLAGIRQQARVGPVTRNIMKDVNAPTAHLSGNASPTTDIADINYWLPQ